MACASFAMIDDIKNWQKLFGSGEILQCTRHTTICRIARPTVDSRTGRRFFDISRGVTRLDGAPMFKPGVFWKHMCCWRKHFRHCWDFRRPGICPPSLCLWTYPQNLRLSALFSIVHATLVRHTASYFNRGRTNNVRVSRFKYLLPFVSKTCICLALFFLNNCVQV